MAGRFYKQNRGRSVAINTILCIRMIRSIRAIPSCIAITAAFPTWLASHILIYILTFRSRRSLGRRVAPRFEFTLWEEVRIMRGQGIASGIGALMASAASVGLATAAIMQCLGISETLSVIAGMSVAFIGIAISCLIGMRIARSHP